MPLNVKLAQELRNWVAGEAAVEALEGVDFDMGDYVRDHYRHEDQCGTSCCFAGAITVIESGVPAGHATWSQMHNFMRTRGYGGFAKFARDALGLDEEQADHLFHPTDRDEGEPSMVDLWGGEFDYSDITRAWGVQVLDHLIATGEVDWSVGMPDRHMV